MYFTADRLDNWKQAQEFVIHVEADDESDDSDEEDSDITDYESEDDDDDEI